MNSSNFSFKSATVIIVPVGIIYAFAVYGAFQFSLILGIIGLVIPLIIFAFVWYLTEPDTKTEDAKK